MSIKQHFARWKETEAAKLRPMTAKQRAGYILHYYRFWFIGLALLLLVGFYICLLYTSPSPRDGLLSRMPSSA